ncbi:MAG: glycosyltransferase family 2 protein [Alphaproteobacteria bacterium]|nr:glycosyltransferase family 2 protein [Alphaproteobacteria bacterium]
MLIVTLSSIPPRFSTLGPTLESLIAQTAKPDRILLYIPRQYRRFPGWNGNLPLVPAGVEIKRCDDLGPTTKVLPAAFELGDHDCSLFFCDDDRLYQRDLLAHFLAAQKQHPDCCIASAGKDAYCISPGSKVRSIEPRPVRRWRSTDLGFQVRYLMQDLWAGRARKEFPEPPRKVFKCPGYVDLFEGFGGVLVKPNFFERSDAEIPPVMWTVDDVWLSGMLARKNIPIWVIAQVMEPQETKSHLAAALHTSIVDGATQGDAEILTVNYLRKTYGIWL